MRLITKLIVVLIVGTLFWGCSVANYVVEPYAKLRFETADNINPDMNGRASPVVVRIYELSSRTLFDSHDFFTLFEGEEQVLGANLINSTELEFEPGKNYDFDLTLKPGVRYAGILVAFRDIDAASWREVVEIEPTEYKTFDVHVGELSVFVNNP
ncbi:type VI secretion system lipoprotein TssJ [Vibrio sp. SCSIO 43136]|uniref:type VI secretion system lipoprotein TssJ n=1 Tax=Vibrio sp. SCSIO 43136 TaxID=2819101 RepID=UPI002074EF1C|nr:type VI secretion system lipoprotein TssJ [Vibrio sp. SCSIO 43136]USD67504.1 type VI secretion system lipoprotein TssJ [Vibrio sp. SCSIO 43136]